MIILISNRFINAKLYIMVSHAIIVKNAPSLDIDINAWNALSIIYAKFAKKLLNMNIILSNLSLKKKIEKLIIEIFRFILFYIYC